MMHEYAFNPISVNANKIYLSIFRPCAFQISGVKDHSAAGREVGLMAAVIGRGL